MELLSLHPRFQFDLPIFDLHGVFHGVALGLLFQLRLTKYPHAAH
jgi:hypothetical protein